MSAPVEKLFLEKGLIGAISSDEVQVRAIASDDRTSLSFTIDGSIESHAMGFAAWRSRKGGTLETVDAGKLA